VIGKQVGYNLYCLISDCSVTMAKTRQVNSHSPGGSKYRESMNSYASATKKDLPTATLENEASPPKEILPHNTKDSSTPAPAAGNNQTTPINLDTRTDNDFIEDNENLGSTDAPYVNQKKLPVVSQLPLQPMTPETQRQLPFTMLKTKLHS